MKPLRFRLRAFVCQDANVTHTSHEGWMSVHQIWVERALGCRYAIVENTHGGVQLWDLHHEDWSDWLEDGDDRTAPPGRAFTDIDAAISAALMRYDQGVDDDPA